MQIALDLHMEFCIRVGSPHRLCVSFRGTGLASSNVVRRCDDPASWRVGPGPSEEGCPGKTPPLHAPSSPLSWALKDARAAEGELGGLSPA